MNAVHAALNRLAKWRSVFAGWQLGTRLKGDPESDALRDHREATLLQRVELSALSNVLIKKGLITVEELQSQMLVECDLMQKMLEARFPGIRATDYGLSMDERAKETMKEWPP